MIDLGFICINEVYYSKMNNMLILLANFMVLLNCLQLRMAVQCLWTCIECLWTKTGDFS